MDIIITAKLNSLELKSSALASKDWEDKFLLKENHAKILAWCKDHHVRAYWNSVDKKSELVQDLDKANFACFGLLDKLHTEFMQFVEKLPSSKHWLEKSEISEKNRKFVKHVLENWDETNERAGIDGAKILGKDSQAGMLYPIGYINEGLLKQMFEAWLQVYDK